MTDASPDRGIAERTERDRGTDVRGAGSTDRLDHIAIDLVGARDYTFTLTAAAKARGWDAAFGPGVLRLETAGGRGKTSHPDDAPKQGVLSTKEGQSGRGERI